MGSGEFSSFPRSAWECILEALPRALTEESGHQLRMHFSMKIYFISHSPLSCLENKFQNFE
ncbi:MAG: hypothetical protein DSM106950_41565 [Stigonema ocellatum SAG 48.90 = DSM 106950]|nr:hypothetical protein [Stigonema ocellatum SAG 48.90 = DSM 106950]